jgi:hypothetical protein
VNRLTRDVKTKPTHATTDQHNAHVESGEEDLARRGEPVAPVHVQPVDTGETVTEPGSEQGANQTQQVAEDGDSVGDNPGNDPAGETDENPGAVRGQVAAVHTVSAAEETDVDVLKTNVTVDDTGTNNLSNVSDDLRSYLQTARTVGIAMP